jgi:hypothetical protein
VLRGTGMSHSKRHRWLLAAPFAWQAGLAPLVNDVALQPFGLPFPMVWQMLGILLTSVCIAIVYRLDRRQAARSERR